MLKLNTCKNFYEKPEISFKADIVFVSNSKFDELYDREGVKDVYWDALEASRKIGTKGANGCIEATLAYPKEVGVILHASPAFNYGNNFNIIPEGFNQKSPKTDKKPSGFLVGGQFISSFHSASDHSKLLSRKLIKMLEEKAKSVTKFLGHKLDRGISSILYDSDDDVLYINARDKNSPCNKLINSPEDVKRFYSEIEVSNNDHVYIEGDDKEYGNSDLSDKITRIQNGIRLEYYKETFDRPIDESGERYAAGFNEDSKSVNLYPGSYGSEKSVLWVDSEEEEAIKGVVEHIDLLKEIDMFKDAKIIEYAGDKQIKGFTKTGKADGRGKSVFSAKIEEIKKTFTANLPEWALIEIERQKRKRKK